LLRGEWREGGGMVCRELPLFVGDVKFSMLFLPVI